ncbi:invasion associated locus B family protein [Aquabacter cavernae]|uniref:invasion associated locus B family protein n=1 Tax=Aquabacter cavernae TaxID=2496029 RepID=UPI000F8E238B|nr:invasion associated locus B family protein [Aquabacter cavernae]
MRSSFIIAGATLAAAGVLWAAQGGIAQAQQAQPAPARPAAAAPAAPAAAAAAADPAQPVATTATYQDWLMRCVAQADKSKVCEIVQNLQVQGQGTVASIAVGRPDPKAAVSLVIQLPQGVWLPAGVKFQVSEKAKPLQLEYKRCAQACVAEVSLDAAAVQALKSATEPGSFTFEDGSRRAVTLPVSLKGFGPALDASLKS